MMDNVMERGLYDTRPATPSQFGSFRVDIECGSQEPTTTQTAVPTMDPTPEPTDRTSVQPTSVPTVSPTVDPSASPSHVQPTPAPTDPMELLCGDDVLEKEGEFDIGM